MELANQFSLTGRVALVTGGTSGIGLSIARAYAAMGAGVAVVSRDRGRVDAAVAALQPLVAAGGGAGAMGLAHDVSDTATHAAIVDAVVARLGRLDILVNAAGATLKKPVVETTEEDYDRIFGLNLRAMYFMCQKAACHMLAHGGGKIINIASLASYRALTEVSLYCISKAGVESLTKSLACEWAKGNVAVNAIAPGVFRTPLNSKLLDIPERMQLIVSRTPIGRVGQLDELQGTAVFLASAASDYVRGHTLAVDGGFLAYGF